MTGQALREKFLHQDSARAYRRRPRSDPAADSPGAHGSRTFAESLFPSPESAKAADCPVWPLTTAEASDTARDRREAALPLTPAPGSEPKASRKNQKTVSQSK